MGAARPLKEDHFVPDAADRRVINEEQKHFDREPEVLWVDNRYSVKNFHWLAPKLIQYMQDNIHDAEYRIRADHPDQLFTIKMTQLQVQNLQDQRMELAGKIKDHIFKVATGDKSEKFKINDKVTVLHYALIALCEMQTSQLLQAQKFYTDFAKQREGQGKLGKKIHKSQVGQLLFSGEFESRSEILTKRVVILVEENYLLARRLRGASA